jgi:hypothetical protein
VTVTAVTLAGTVNVCSAPVEWYMHEVAVLEKAFGQAGFAAALAGPAAQTAELATTTAEPAATAARRIRARIAVRLPSLGG